MARGAREEKISRRGWLLAGLTIPLFSARSEEPLSVSFDGDNLHIAAPGLHFLGGGVLKRLNDADTVTFLSQITLFNDDRGTSIFKRVPHRIIVSHDLWENKFAVTIPGAPARTTLHNTAAQAEAWVIDNLVVSALGLTPDHPFWLRFELRAATQKELSTIVGDTGISLQRVVEFFSRKSAADNPAWVMNTPMLRLNALPRRVLHGRNG